MKLNYTIKHIMIAFPLALGISYGCGGKDPEPETNDAGIIDADAATGPEIKNAEVEYYQVNGDNCEEVKQDIFDEENGKGYLIDGERRAGKTEFEFGFTPVYKPVPKESEDPKRYCCDAVIDPLTTYCNATVYLPQWDGNDKCWDQFIDGLIIHEQGHVDICKEYKDRLQTTLSGLSSSECSMESMTKACNDALDDLEQKANSAYKTTFNDFNAAQQAYDAENDHGAAQGATLDCDCE